LKNGTNYIFTPIRENAFKWLKMEFEFCLFEK